jgi:hypothetical protein
MSASKLSMNISKIHPLITEIKIQTLKNIVSKNFKIFFQKFWFKIFCTEKFRLHPDPSSHISTKISDFKGK